MHYYLSMQEEGKGSLGKKEVKKTGLAGTGKDLDVLSKLPQALQKQALIADIGMAVDGPSIAEKKKKRKK